MNTIGLHEEDFDKHFKLMADIDLGGFGEREFNIIGNFLSPFRGVFDGNGHAISNFHYVSTDVDVNDVAMFLCVQGGHARITDLGLIDPVIDVNSSELDVYVNPDDPNSGAIYGNTAGALVNYLSRGALLSHCYVRGGSISGDTWVGGLVSNACTGTIDNCYSATEVSGELQVGGLAGYSVWSTITNCHSTSNIRGESIAGGLVGDNDGTIQNCSAEGDVTCDSTAGGLAGKNTGKIESSYSTANVTGVQESGGLVGRSHGDIINCYSSGSISGQRSVGGLVGIVKRSITIANCSSAGTVIGVEYVGGLAGSLNDGTLYNCYSTSSVSGERFVGGLVGTLDDYLNVEYATVINCYSAGKVAGITQVGGLAGGGYSTANFIGSFWDMETSGQTTSFRGTGGTTAEMRTAATFLDAGWDFLDETENGADDIWWITEGQDYPRLWWQAGD
jgi:hypothetical protein